MGSKGFQGYVERRKKDVDSHLNALYGSKREAPLDFYRAMAYSLLDGGKRLRPVLCLATVRACGGDEDRAVPLACAVEIVHTFALIHDDLPALDDDNIRRGKPTNHKVFGEGVAMLAANALLIDAFHLLSHPDCLHPDGAEKSLALIREFASHIGSAGTMKGQALELAARDPRSVDAAQLEYIYIQKTGKLILAAVLLGAAFSGAGREDVQALTQYGEAVGLAFAIANDLRDVEEEGVEPTPRGWKDRPKRKVTYPALMGPAEARRRVEELIAQAEQALSGFGPAADHLRAMARHMVSR